MILIEIYNVVFIKKGTMKSDLLFSFHPISLPLGSIQTLTLINKKKKKKGKGRWENYYIRNDMDNGCECNVYSRKINVLMFWHFSYLRLYTNRKVWKREQMIFSFFFFKCLFIYKSFLKKQKDMEWNRYSIGWFFGRFFRLIKWFVIKFGCEIKIRIWWSLKPWPSDQ